MVHCVWIFRHQKTSPTPPPAPCALKSALGYLLALMAAQPEAVRPAYRARSWACALDVLQLAATAASAREVTAAAGRESGGLLPASSAGQTDTVEVAAASWYSWSQQLMEKHRACVAYTEGRGHPRSQFSGHNIIADFEVCLTYCVFLYLAHSLCLSLVTRAMLSFPSLTTTHMQHRGGFGIHTPAVVGLTGAT